MAPLLGRLDWQFIGVKQQRNSFTAVAIMTQESPAGSIGVLFLSSGLHFSELL